ncbi:hypothetical protein [Bradyrhizobium japonicum]|uniref:hypothetical protein n=1 Tax=Bradyrhizobium japonicum TaxID=375 RepID=UPI00117F079B|nr:hypothetical protein [Bradyrhizobium japonicum]
MSSPSPQTLECERDKLFLTDAELIRRLGVPEKIARVNLRMLDAKPGDFPKKQKLWGDRRYWPAVVGYFDQHYGFRISSSPSPR